MSAESESVGSTGRRPLGRMGRRGFVGASLRLGGAVVAATLLGSKRAEAARLPNPITIIYTPTGELLATISPEKVPSLFPEQNQGGEIGGAALVIKGTPIYWVGGGVSPENVGAIIKNLPPQELPEPTVVTLTGFLFPEGRDPLGVVEGSFIPDSGPFQGEEIEITLLVDIFGGEYSFFLSSTEEEGVNSKPVALAYLLGRGILGKLPPEGKIAVCDAEGNFQNLAIHTARLEDLKPRRLFLTPNGWVVEMEGILLQTAEGEENFQKKNVILHTTLEDLGSLLPEGWERAGPGPDLVEGLRKLVEIDLKSLVFGAMLLALGSRLSKKALERAVELLRSRGERD